MKKFFFWFMVAATMMMAGCEKLNNVLENEDDNGGGANGRSGKKLAKVTRVHGVGGSQTNVEELRFTWDGDKLAKIDLWDGDVLEESADFTYDSRGLSEIRSTDYRFVFDYANGRVKEIALYYGGIYRWTATVSYNALGNISNVGLSDGSDMNFTWRNGNVVEHEVVSEGRNTYTYDSKSNPFNMECAFFMALRAEEYAYFSNNNVLEKRWIPLNGSSSDRTYTYTYDESNTWPVTCSYTSSGESGTDYYLYADGTGSAGPGGGGQTSYTVSVVANNSSYGYVTGGGTYAAGSTATITAYPYSGYQFSHWNDGNTSNPRTITVTGNATYTAYFTASGGGGSSTTSVTFGSSTWSNVYPNTQYGIKYYTAYDVLAGNLFENTNYNYPYIYMQIGDPSVGTTSMPVGDDGYISGNYNVLEYYENTSLMSVSNGDTTYYGDWWGKSATVTFASLDFNAHTANLTVNATMFDAYGAFIDQEGIDGAETRSLVISLPSLNFTQASKAVHAVQGMRQRQIAPGTLRVAR